MALNTIKQTNNKSKESPGKVIFRGFYAKVNYDSKPTSNKQKQHKSTVENCDIVTMML